jgi:hypothetical protein
MSSTTETQNERYNGWKNYPTWAVNLWLSNDEALYTGSLALAERANQGDYPRAAVADAFKSWVREDLAPDLGASFAADLLGYALDEVDWDEIADSWLESARDV